MLHVGANSGQEAEEYLRLGIKRTIWIEAHEPTYQELLRHISSICCGSNITTRFDKSLGERAVFQTGDAIQICLNACVSDTDGKDVNFGVANNGSQSSSFLELGTHSVEHPSVHYVEMIPMKTTRLDTLLAEFVPFQPGAFLNCDLQGAELLALRGMGEKLNEFDHLYLEVNDRSLYVGCALVGEVDAFLAERGFSRVETKMTGNHWGDAYYHRIKP